MKKLFFKYCFPLLFFFCASLYARTVEQEIVFRQIRMEDGLSQSTVYNILQDSKGYLWFGTANGLNRYDGYNFQIFSNNPLDSTTISDNGIIAIHEDKKGHIWIGTSEGVLNKYNRKTGEFQRFYITENLKITDKPINQYYDFPIPFSRNSNNTITSIAEGPDNTLWIGTWGLGIIRFNYNNNSTQHFHYDSHNPAGLQSNSIKTIYVDGNFLWIGTLDCGLFKYNTATNVWTNYKYQAGNNYGLSDNKIYSIYKDKNENLWIGTFGGGLNLLSDKEQTKPASEARFRHYKYIPGKKGVSNNIITSLLQDRKGSLWIGTYGGGIDKLDLSTGVFKNYHFDPNIPTSLSKNDILSIYEDASGTIWVGTHLGKGLSKLETSVEKFNRVVKDEGGKRGLNDDVVWAIIEDEDSVVWIGTYKGGLNKWDRKNGKFSYYNIQQGAVQKISDNHIRSLKDDSKNLLIGTYNRGVCVFNKATGKFQIYSHNPNDTTSLGANQIQSILIDKEKIYWFGTFGGGLNKIISMDENGNAKFKRYVYNKNNPFSLNDNRVYTIFEDNEGLLWIGTFGGGLVRFDKNKERFIAYKNIPGDETSISDNRVMSVYEDKKNNLWVGTYGGGLHKFDKQTEKFIRYDQKNKPNSSVVYGILEDNNNNLWMSTDNGLFKFNINSENFTRYDLHDGLQSLEFSGGAYYKSKNGEMFFGGINGFNYFFPDSVKDNYYVPPIVLSNIKVFNQPFRGERDTIKLTYDQNFLSLEFSALDYTNPQDNQYAYKLEGFDDQWIYVDARNRIANYTNLSPGKYVFKVRGSNNDGVWNNIGAELTLFIAPPFWRTWWFITLSVLAIGLVVFYMGSIRYRNLLIIEKLKTKLSADLHDNVGSGLTEISILSELAAHEFEKAMPDSSHRLNTISEKARLLVDNMSDIVWMVNPQRDSLYHLMLRLKDSYSDFINALGISFSTINIDKFTEVKLPMEYRQHLFLIFKEAINNAIKHSKCKKITLEANLKNDILELILKDDGIGIEEKIVKYGNGIQNMKSRAASIGGELSVSSSVKGTIIKFNGRTNRFYKLVPFLK